MVVGLQTGIQQDLCQHREHDGAGGAAELRLLGHLALPRQGAGPQPEDGQSAAGAGAHQVISEYYYFNQNTLIKPFILILGIRSV